MRFFHLLLCSILSTGCYVEFYDSPERSNDSDYHDDWEETNYTPVVFDAYVDCWWNHSIDDYVWAFEAGVDHGNGYSEVSDVFVEIYQGRYIETINFSYDYNGYWEAVVDERFTNLWCGDWYEMDVIAYDWDGDWDVMTIEM